MSGRLVEKPLTIKFRDLVNDFDQITCPVTLVCAGNRRKEQNVVRKTKGFSWGAAGVSNALWTGVAMGEVLKKAGLKRGARYVCMEGADKLVCCCYLEFRHELTNVAKWILRHVCQAQLGLRSQQGHDARLQDEWRDADTRSWQAAPSSYPWTDWRS